MSLWKQLFGIHLFALLALTACTTEPKLSELPVTADPQVELDRVRGNLKTAQDNQVNVLAPTSFKSASQALEKAYKGRAENADQKKILHQISLAQGFLDQANARAAVSGQILASTMVARHDAIQAKSENYFPKDLAFADSALVKATGEAEENNTSQAEKKRQSLEAMYRGLELKSIKFEKIEPARATIQTAVNEGARKLTPDTLAWAEKAFAEDEVVIERARHNFLAVEKASNDARDSANRLLKMVREAKGSSQKNPEELAKRVEQNQQALAKGDRNLDRAEMALLRSQGQLAKSEGELTKSRDDLNESEGSLANSQGQLTRSQGELSNAQGELANASAKNEVLQSQVWLDKEYVKARSAFAASEADVYKQGDSLLLRLKGLSFANNKSEITTDNFAILAKVQKIMSDIGESQVSVEGHTDSIGVKQANLDLSTQRAVSVQTYLISNRNVEAGKITATGFGDAKPIATNKTASGRAQNRRVDILIQSKRM